MHLTPARRTQHIGLEPIKESFGDFLAPCACCIRKAPDRTVKRFEFDIILLLAHLPSFERKEHRMLIHAYDKDNRHYEVYTDGSMVFGKKGDLFVKTMSFNFFLEVVNQWDSVSLYLEDGTPFTVNPKTWHFEPD